MMQQLRKNMPLILWILLIAFVLTIIFSWGMGGFKEKENPNLVGIIAGQEIKVDNFEEIVNRQIEQYTQQNNVEPQDQTVSQIRQQTWDNLIREILLEKEAKRLGIMVSDQEVVDQITNNPPQFLQSHPSFQTDGQFDMNKYLAFLQSPQNRDQVIYLEDTYRTSMLQQKLLKMVTESVVVPETELYQRFEERNVMGSAKYVTFQPDSFKLDSSIVTEEEIRNYYNKHIKEYAVPEQRRILFVQFDNETSAEDSANINDLAADIKQRLDKGEDFGYLALIYSDHHTASDSGKLGWMPKLQLEPEADSIVWKTPVGKYFGPLQTVYGLQFYKVIGREKQEGELKSDMQIIQLKYLPSADTKDAIANRAQSFSEEIKENDFVQTAQTYKVKVDTSGWFQKEGSFVPGLGKVVAQVEWAFNNPVGSTSDVYPLRNGWLVFKVIDKKEAKNAPLEEKRESIFTEIYTEKRADAAYNACQEFYNSLKEKSMWTGEAMNRGLVVDSTEREFRFGDYVKNIGRDGSFTASIFRAKIGELYGPVKGMNCSFLLELTSVTPMDSAAFASGKYEHINELIQKKQEMAYTTWYEQLKAKHKIEDFRYKFYRKM